MLGMSLRQISGGHAFDCLTVNAKKVLIFHQGYFGSPLPHPECVDNNYRVIALSGMV
jgi:hypothetical protein